MGVDPRVRLTDDHRQAVEADRQLDERDLLLLRTRSISVLLIGRDASAMSSSSLQNFWKPPPVPEMPTVTLTRPAVVRWNSSAIASVTGEYS